jgi:hypothetical protein
VAGHSNARTKEDMIAAVRPRILRTNFDQTQAVEEKNLICCPTHLELRRIWFSTLPSLN